MNGKGVKLLEMMEWVDLALMLEIDYDVIKSIKKEYTGEDRCKEMFRHWLDGEACMPLTWGRLIQALEDLELSTLVENLRSALGK